jgi:hypothetical protein
MAIVYTDTGDLLTSSSLWSDQNLTIKVVDGWYQAGGVYREMRSGELLKAQTCPSCDGPAPPETVFVAAVRIQSQGLDCSAETFDSSAPFSAVVYIASDYPDFVLNPQGKLVLDNTSGLSFGGIETTLYNPADSNIVVVPESITSSSNGLLLGTSSYSTIVNDESLLDIAGPDIISSVSSLGSVQFSLCGF